MLPPLSAIASLLSGAETITTIIQVSGDNLEYNKTDFQLALRRNFATLVGVSVSNIGLRVSALALTRRSFTILIDSVAASSSSSSTVTLQFFIVAADTDIGHGMLIKLRDAIADQGSLSSSLGVTVISQPTTSRRPGISEDAKAAFRSSGATIVAAAMHEAAPLPPPPPQQSLWHDGGMYGSLVLSVIFLVALAAFGMWALREFLQRTIEPTCG